MASPSITTTALLVLLSLAPAVFAVDYPISWTLGTSYDGWDSDKTLVAGDTITFSYGPSHSVSVVKKDTYDNCGLDALQSFNGGKSTVPLTAGTMYFTCQEGNHCANGMKLSVKVSDGAPPKSLTPPGVISSPPPAPPKSLTPPGVISSPPPAEASIPGTPKQQKENGAATSKYNLNFMVIGGSLLLAPLLALLG